jgi:hypothetical protein
MNVIEREIATSFFSFWVIMNVTQEINNKNLK